ncbi:hypothetical protein FHW72_001830 [Ochrobactrum sp. RC6B]|nr:MULTISPECIES: hypothetical protein [Brucella/Ochrobactrum group]MBB3216759.1 hypothetical protein [Ochrobactrum sp. RC6B]
MRAPSFLVGDDDGNEEVSPVAVAVPVLPKAHEVKEHDGDGDGQSIMIAGW